MFKDKPLWRILLLLFALVALLAASGNTAETRKGPKASKPDKSTGKEAAPPVKMELEPKAVEILKAACDKLAAARSMSFTAVATYENPSRLGTPLAYTTKSEVTLKRPDKLRVITLGDGPAS